MKRPVRLVVVQSIQIVMCEQKSIAHPTNVSWSRRKSSL